MSLLRSLRAYIGLGPDEEYEDRYLYDLDLRNEVETDLEDEIDSELDDDREIDRDNESDGDEIDLTDNRFRGDGHRRGSARSNYQADNGWANGEPTDDDVDFDSTGPLEVMPDGPSDLASDVPVDARAGRKSRQSQHRTNAKQARKVGQASDDGVVRSLDRHRGRPRTITPASFSDSKILADEFNRGVPIVLDLQGQGRELSRRLIDFASGVCYVLDGSMEKVSPHVFLLTPKSATVSKQDRRLIEEGGYDR